MKAHQLARILLKKPNIPVGVQMIDNNEYEVGAWPFNVVVMDKDEFAIAENPDCDLDTYDAQPNRWVAITCR